MESNSVSSLSADLSVEDILKAVSSCQTISSAQVASTKDDIRVTSNALERAFAPSAVYPVELCVVVEHKVYDPNNPTLGASNVSALTAKYPLFLAASYWSTHGKGLRLQFRSLEDLNAALNSVVKSSSGDRSFALPSSGGSPVVVSVRPCPPIDLGVKLVFSNVPPSFLSLKDPELGENIARYILAPGEANAVVNVHRPDSCPGRLSATRVTVWFSSAPVRCILQDATSGLSNPRRVRPVFVDPAYPSIAMSWQWGYPHVTCPHCKQAGHSFPNCAFASCRFEGSDVYPPVASRGPSQPSSVFSPVSAPAPKPSFSPADRVNAAKSIAGAAFNAASTSRKGQSLLLSPLFSGPPPALSSISPEVASAALTVDWGELPFKANAAQVASVVRAVYSLDHEMPSRLAVAFKLGPSDLPSDVDAMVAAISDLLIQDFGDQSSLPVLANCLYAQFMSSARASVYGAIAGSLPAPDAAPAPPPAAPSSYAAAVAKPAARAAAAKPAKTAAKATAAPAAKSSAQPSAPSAPKSATSQK